MAEKNFVHLHVHSDHSLLDGYSTIDEYIEKAVELGQPGLALTDHNSMTAIYTFIKKCKKAGIKPIPGIEINLAPDNPLGAKAKNSIQYGDRGLVSKRGASVHLTLLAKNYKGLQNLFKLTHLSYNPENFYTVPRIDLEILKNHSEGIIVLSGCPNSEINLRFRLNQDEKAYEYASILKEIFKDDFYIEIMNYKTIPDYSQQKLLKLSKDLGIKAVFTNDVHYAKKEDSSMQEMVMALGNGSKMDETPSYKGGFRLALGGNERYLKSFEEMKELYQYEKMPELIDNTIEIFNKIENIEIFYDNKLRPTVEIPKEFPDNVSYLKHILNEGFKRKRGNQSKEIQQESVKRVKSELETVVSNDFVDYFLVVWDYIKWSRDNGYPVGAGRGSVAGSEIAYLLDISRTDPIRFDLMFDRFISPGRGATYQIEYEDGTIEEINVAEKKIVNGKEKYIYQLSEGDIVE